MNRILYFLTIILCNNYITFSQTNISELEKSYKSAQNDTERIKILDDLTVEMIKSNHQKKKQYLKEIINLSEENKLFDLAAQKSRFLIQDYLNEGKLDTVLLTVNKALKNKAKFSEKKSEAHIILKRAAYYYDIGELKNAANDYDNAADMFLKTKDSIFVADARFFAGQVYSDLGDFISSIKRFTKAHKFYELLGDKDYVDFTVNELSNLYGRNGFHNKVIEQAKKVIPKAKKAKNYLTLTHTYNKVSLAYLNKKELLNAKKYADSTKMFCDKIKYSRPKEQNKIEMKLLYLRYFLEKEDLLNAQKCSEEIKKEFDFNNLPQFYKNSFLLFSGILSKKLKSYDKAIVKFKELIKNNGNMGDFYLTINAKKELSEIYQFQKKYTEAYELLKEYTVLKDEYLTKVNNNAFLYYQSEFETHRKDDEIFKSKTEIKLLKMDKDLVETKQKGLLALLILAVLIFVIVVYYVKKQAKYKREYLKERIEKNKKELKEFTHQLIEKSKIQESLTVQLEKLQEEIGTINNAEKIQELKATKILTQDDWYIFKEKFTKVYPCFFMTLKEKGFKLTKSEERLLAMEKLYLDTNEIAVILGISKDSVVRSKSRLRNKINAPKGTSILEFFDCFDEKDK